MGRFQRNKRKIVNGGGNDYGNERRLLDAHLFQKGELARFSDVCSIEKVSGVVLDTFYESLGIQRDAISDYEALVKGQMVEAVFGRGNISITADRRQGSGVVIGVYGPKDSYMEYAVQVAINETLRR